MECLTEQQLQEIVGILNLGPLRRVHMHKPGDLSPCGALVCELARGLRG